MEEVATKQEEVVLKNILQPQEKKIEEQLKPTDYFLFLNYPPGDSIIREDELILFEELRKITTDRKNTHIILVLNSFGGNIYAAFKMVKMIRSKCDKLIAVVPQWAKSAATLMCLGADEIVMAEQSELGPLDKPIEHPHLEGVSISALDVINGMKYLQQRAKELTFEIAQELISEAGMNKKDALNSATKLAIGIVNPILAKEDPRIISQSFRLLRIAEHYGRDLLKMGMVKNWKLSDDRENKMVDSIMDIFVWKYPDHAFAIVRDEAEELLLKIVKAENFSNWERIWSFYISLKSKKTINVYLEKDLEMKAK